MLQALHRRNSVRIAVAIGVLLAAFAGAAKFGGDSGPMLNRYGRWAQVNGHPMYYEVRGSGAPLILLHGGGDSIAGSFAKQLDVFTRDHEVIAPEQVGQGHTPDINGPLSYSQMMEDTASLLRQLGVRHADVVGWSDGGNIALMLAARYPELVRRVVVSGANFSPAGLRDDQIAALRQSRDQQPSESPSFEDKLTTLWLTAPTATELGPQVLSRIEQPVLVMAGDHDVIKLEHTLALYTPCRTASSISCPIPITAPSTSVRSGSTRWWNPFCAGPEPDPPWRPVGRSPASAVPHPACGPATGSGRDAFAAPALRCSVRSALRRLRRISPTSGTVSGWAVMPKCSLSS
jgi:alpha-beta hydrolase superfamily lysophospholipase